MKPMKYKKGGKAAPKLKVSNKKVSIDPPAGHHWMKAAFKLVDHGKG